MADYKIPKIKVPRFCEAEGFYTTPARSKMMANIGGKNTKPELQLRKALWAAGVRFRVNVKTLIGKPDIASKKWKFAVFVDGGFWHGYQWETRKPKLKENREFWIPKIERNMQRDQEVNQALEAQGYKVFRFWDHEVKTNLGHCLNQLFTYLERKERLP